MNLPNIHAAADRDPRGVLGQPAGIAIGMARVANADLATVDPGWATVREFLDAAALNRMHREMFPNA